MKTDDLIRALAADATAEPPLARTLLIGLVPALAVGLAGLVLTLGVRADLAAALHEPLSVMRFVLTAALSLVALRLALILARPGGRPSARFWPLALLAAISAGLWVWAFVTTPPQALQMAVVGKTMVACLVSIPLIAVLPVAAVLAMLRRGATTAPIRAGAVAGLAGGGAAAAIYALHCTEDSPLFYVTWYGLAILGVTVVSALIGARLLRW